MKGMFLELPVTDYERVHALQKRLVRERASGRLDREVVILVEHPSVYTLGNRGGRENLMVSEASLEAKGIPVIQTERGGNITWHGPGQLVAYPIVHLEKAGTGVADFVGLLEGVMVKTLSALGVSARRDEVNRGVWANRAKIGSVGIRVTNGVSFHGLALNVAPDLTCFSWINPCGLKVAVTTAEKELGEKISLKRARDEMKRAFETLFSEGCTATTLQDLEKNLCRDKGKRHQRTGKPAWLRRSLPASPRYEKVRRLIRESSLHTVCQAARCPNLWECFSNRTATFLILGETCTRRCRFCAIRGGTPLPPDPEEPRRVAEAAREMNLSYVVVTSVTRDDLEDGGASCFAETLGALREAVEGVYVEVLIPDFKGNGKDIQRVITAGPDVLNHNIETVPRLYATVKPQAIYQRSLDVFRCLKMAAPELPGKSGLMLGLGETDAEVEATLADLLAAGCSILTLGQYLQPSRAHLPVKNYVTPEAFDAWKQRALAMGFAHVASGPFVRSSYKAKELLGRGTSKGH